MQYTTEALQYYCTILYIPDVLIAAVLSHTVHPRGKAVLRTIKYTAEALQYHPTIHHPRCSAVLHTINYTEEVLQYHPTIQYIPDYVLY